jgi:hypothetical protein
MASIGIDWEEFLRDRAERAAFAEKLVTVAGALGVGVEYLVTGGSNESEIDAVIWQLEAVIEDIKKL